MTPVQPHTADAGAALRTCPGRSRKRMSRLHHHGTVGRKSSKTGHWRHAHPPKGSSPSPRQQLKIMTAASDKEQTIDNE